MPYSQSALALLAILAWPGLPALGWAQDAAAPREAVQPEPAQGPGLPISTDSASGQVLPQPQPSGSGPSAPSAGPGEAPKEGGEQGFEGFEEFAKPEGEAPREVFDPLIGYNRLMFNFNDKFWLYVWRPTAKGFAFVVPEPARVALNRVYLNVRYPLRVVNCLLQLKLKKTGVETGRFLVNSTLGLAGLFDPAEKWLGWKAPDAEDFGQTLGRYGVGEGFPVMLPFIGPSNVRDGLGWIPDFYANPIVYFVSFNEGVAIGVGDYFNRSSLYPDEYSKLKKDALDPYTFFRDAYSQLRKERIRK